MLSAYSSEHFQTDAPEVVKYIELHPILDIQTAFKL